MQVPVDAEAGVVGSDLGDVVLGDGDGPVMLSDELGLGGEVGGRLDDQERRRSGLSDDAGPDCAARWAGAGLVRHFGAAATGMRLWFSDARQA